jgi:hypothetical protein
MTSANGKFSNRDYATLEALVKLSRNVIGPARSLLGDMAASLELFASGLDGVPVAIRDIENGKQYQVTAVSVASLPDAYFNGYGRFQKQAISGLLH